MMADRGIDAYKENINAAVSRWKALLDNKSASGLTDFIDAPTQQDLGSGALTVFKSIPDNVYVKKVQQNVSRRIKTVLAETDSERRVNQTQNWLVGCVKEALVEVESEDASLMGTSGRLEGDTTPISLVYRELIPSI